MGQVVYFYERWVRGKARRRVHNARCCLVAARCAGIDVRNGERWGSMHAVGGGKVCTICGERIAKPQE